MAGRLSRRVRESKTVWEAGETQPALIATYLLKGFVVVVFNKTFLVL